MLTRQVAVLRSDSAQFTITVGINERGKPHLSVFSSDPTDARKAQHHYFDQSADPVAALRHAVDHAEKQLEQIKADWAILQRGRSF